MAILIFLLHAGLLSFASHAALVPREQMSFPPANGPCNQNTGLAPLQCSDPACVDIPTSGVCNIQSQSGSSLSPSYKDQLTNPLKVSHYVVAVILILQSPARHVVETPAVESARALAPLA